MICQVCGRRLKNAKSLELGYGPTCYRRIFPKSRNCTSTKSDSVAFDMDYTIPGQMELNEFIEFPKNLKGG